ncbi:hypothetical protein [Parasitella parasitica]|uniref:Uncharacterized protein n=1 Tax=Parasitella parasitica TaxID=35722 RepID=A0A0B7NKE9_9FUNG|nr:hypothetical protein [Parasitella parasitica]
MFYIPEDELPVHKEVLNQVFTSSIRRFEGHMRAELLSHLVKVAQDAGATFGQFEVMPPHLIIESSPPSSDKITKYYETPGIVEYLQGFANLTKLSMNFYDRPVPDDTSANFAELDRILSKCKRL